MWQETFTGVEYKILVLTLQRPKLFDQSSKNKIGPSNRLHQLSSLPSTVHNDTWLSLFSTL